MNITLFIGSTYGGGAERVTCNLANFLAEKGHNVDLLTMSETKESYDVSNLVNKKSLLRINERGNRLINNAIRVIRFCKYLLSKKDVDAYIVMLPSTIKFFMTFKRLTKSKVIISERADPSCYKINTQRKLRKYARIVDGIVFQTNDAKRWYEDSIKETPAMVIPNAINPQFMRDAFAGNREPVIAAVGRLDKQKNFPLLINAFSKIKNKYPDYKLKIYGEGTERLALEKLVSELDIVDSVELPGNMMNIAELIYKASVFVLPSNFEGMPNSLIEAMALGLPCISTDCPVGGPRFLINDGVNGILVNVNNVDELCDAMDRILASEDYRKMLGKNAALIQKTLSPSVIYNKWEDFIRKSVTEDNY